MLNVHHLVKSSLILCTIITQSSYVNLSPNEPLSTAVGSSFKCPDKFGYYSDVTDCSKYFVCVFGEPLHETCTGGLFFHAELQTCDWPRNVPCADGVDRYSSSSSSSSSVNGVNNHKSDINTPSISVFDVVDDTPDDGDKSVTRSPVDYDLIVDKLRHDLAFSSNHTSTHVNRTEANINHQNYYGNHLIHHASDSTRSTERNYLTRQNISSLPSDNLREKQQQQQQVKVVKTTTNAPKPIIFPTLPLAPPSKSRITDPHHNKIIIDNDDPQPPIYESEAIPPVVDSKGGIHFSDGPGGTYGLSQQIPGIFSTNNNQNVDSYHSSHKSIQLPTLSLFTIKPISLRDKERIASSLTSLLGKRGNDNGSDLNHRYISTSRYRPKQYNSGEAYSNEYIPVISPEASVYAKRPNGMTDVDRAPAPVSFFNEPSIRAINNRPVSYTPTSSVPKFPPPPPPPPTPPPQTTSVELEHLRSQASYSIQPPQSYISPGLIDSIKYRNESRSSFSDNDKGVRLTFKDDPSSSIVMIPIKVASGSRAGMSRVKVIPRVKSFVNNHKNVYFDDEGAYEHVNGPWNKPETSLPPRSYTTVLGSPSTSTTPVTSTTTTSTTSTTTTTTPEPRVSDIETIYGRKENYNRELKSPYGHLKYDLDTNVDDIPDEYDDEYKYTSRVPYRSTSLSTIPPPLPKLSSHSPIEVFQVTTPSTTTTSPAVVTTESSVIDYSPYFVDHESRLLNNRSSSTTTIAPFARINTSPASVTPKTMKSYRKKVYTTPSPRATVTSQSVSMTTTESPLTTIEVTTVKYKNSPVITPTVRSLSNRSTTISIVRQLSAKRSRPTNKRLIVKYRTTQAPKLPSRPESVKPTPVPLTSSSKCDVKKCQPPDCNCGGSTIPGDLKASQVPQIVLITFDDAINDLNWEIYEEIFHSGRKNPNGCPPLGTFYVSHEWTDYGQVQSLYARGHEIASHGITHSFGEKFSKSQWLKEIQGQREIIHMYGGVKLEDIRGMRAPFLQVGGNRMFEMLYEANFTYDSSMPVFDNRPPFYPYTLDYSLNHECMITPCPTKSFPGLWEVGMVMWEDLNGGRCSMGDACSNPSDENGVFTMLLKNFKRHYETNRAPFGLFYHSAWFNTVHHRKGFIKFIDEIMSYGDVYLTTNWQMLQWMRAPTPLNKLKSFDPWKCDAKKLREERPEACNHPSVCNLRHESGSRFMKTCQPCPSVYPWVGNTGFGKQMS